MAQSSAFCRRQEAIERNRASSAILANVRTIATRSAGAWAQEALRAERLEAKAAERLAASRTLEEETRWFSENPDRGHAT